MNRRTFLSASLGAAAMLPAAAASAQQVAAADPRGVITAVTAGLIPDAPHDQTAVMAAALNAAADADKVLFLAAGQYVVAGLELPRRARIAGVAGASRLVFAGGRAMITAVGADLVHFTDIVIDGGTLRLPDEVPGLVHLTGVPDVVIENCAILGSGASGLALDRCGGRVSRSRVSGAAAAGIRAIESTGLSIADNSVTDCGDGGILVHRWTAGEDGTLVIGNRVERIGALSGGTGQYGNGINVFRAHSVIVANNRIADCAFTAVRANAANNVQIVGNNCSRLGEVALYSEFAFEGAIIANNVVDTAATGISIANFMDGGRIASVTGNIIRNITGVAPYPYDTPGFGIGIAVEADAALTGNVIDGAPLAGLWLGWGPYLRDIVATGNVIRRAPVGVAVSVVEGAGAAVITDNVIAGAKDGAVIGMRWAERVTDDLRAGATAFPALLVDRNRVT